MSERVFGEQISIQISKLSKKDLLLPVWVSIIQTVEGPCKTKRWRKSKFSPSVFELGHPSSPASKHWHSWFSVFGLSLGATPPVHPLVLRTSDLDWVMTLTLLVFQLADGRSWDFLSSIISSYNKSHLYLCISLLVLLLWRTLTQTIGSRDSVRTFKMDEHPVELTENASFIFPGTEVSKHSST